MRGLTIRIPEILDYKHLAEYLNTSTTQLIAQAILKDLSQNLVVTLSERAEFELHRYLLGTRARRAEIEVFVLTSNNIQEKKQLSYLVKLAHHFLEPSRSMKASQYELGPKVLAIDKQWICERLFNLNDIWRRKTSTLNIESAKYLGTLLAKKILLMFKIDLIHRFDNFPEHTFILFSNKNIDVKWIDWAKQFSLESAGSATEFLLRSHLTTVLEYLRHIKHSAFAYITFKEEITMYDIKGLHLKQIFENAEKSLTSPNNRFSPQWHKFLNSVDVVRNQIDQ